MPAHPSAEAPTRPTPLILAILAACKGHPDTTDTDVPAVAVTELAWQLDPDVGSVVIASWSQTLPATDHVEYRFDADVWQSTPSFTADAGAQTQVIVGIPFGTNADWRVIADQSGADGPTITTGPLPDGMPIGDVVTSDPSAWEPGDNYLLSSINKRDGGWIGGQYWTFILDRQARVVWAHAAPRHHWTLFPQVSSTGDYLLWDEATYWSDNDNGAGSTVHETWLDGEFAKIATPGLHHAFVQLPDGTLAWGSQDAASTEALVEQGPTETTPTVLWTCGDNWPHSGQCESNGLYYRASTDSFLYSFYTNNSIVEVDRATGQSLWWAGGVRDGYAFDPPTSQYAWQHGISYTPQGTLLVSSHYLPEGADTEETWLMEYQVDHDNAALHYVWGSAAGDGSYAEYNGAAQRLANGDTLHLVGDAGVIREIDPGGTDVWRVDFHGKMLGNGQFIDDLYALVKPREAPAAP